MRTVYVPPRRRRRDRPPEERPPWWVSAVVLLGPVVVLVIALAGCEAQSWPALEYRAPDRAEEVRAREREAEYVRANVRAVKRRYRT